MLKVIFFVPASHKEAVKNALFAAGAGRMGHYQCCSFESLGVGQFMPLSGANPYVGEVAKLTQVEEYKVEMVLEESNLSAVLKALKDNHPYETPAFEVYKLY